ncbi:hypothetical protein COB55_00225 [Candidatus Wolfebacteria bacterium]|nr:MAG: hypothetical protein COB55_00225 [Candidatus Wolfebacteria bacterium]
MKNIIILKSEGNELANQLWNYASIYAYTLERGYKLKNPSFFEYGTFFTIPVTGSLLKILFFLPFINYTKRKTAFRRKVWRKFYTWYSGLVILLHKNTVISYKPQNRKPYYLPPTKESDSTLKKLEQSPGDIYLDGWIFRNPVGIEKYHKEIQEYFQPKKRITSLIDLNIKKLRDNYKNVIGVHIRQGDYKTWRDGEYYIEQKRVREILDGYLKETNTDKTETCFAITSDGQIDTSLFDGLNIFVSKENMVHDLFFLAKTDIILGTNSTFGAFASYYGNISHIVFQKENIDWEYYKNKTTYFENKYSTFVQY